MNLPVILSPAAEQEFDTAADWHERESRLGAKFVAAIQATLDQIEHMSELHAVIEKQVRRSRVAVFPYNIYYCILPDRIEVIAIVHARRDPALWKSRT